MRLSSGHASLMRSIIRSGTSLLHLRLSDAINWQKRCQGAFVATDGSPGGNLPDRGQRCEGACRALHRPDRFAHGASTGSAREHGTIPGRIVASVNLMLDSHRCILHPDHWGTASLCSRELEGFSRIASCADKFEGFFLPACGRNSSGAVYGLRRNALPSGMQFAPVTCMAMVRDASSSGHGRE
jgi:hypothetical protein